GSQPARFKRLVRDGYDSQDSDVVLIRKLLEAMCTLDAQLTEKQSHILEKWSDDFTATFPKGGCSADDQRRNCEANGADLERQEERTLT
ncbi:MAG: hypothetical protein SGPRY_010056, partial [Prymnesium sp.]